MKIESEIKVASQANRFEVYSEGLISAAFFAGEKKVLSVGRIKTGKFDEALGLPEKLRRHMANDCLSAAMDSENVIPFGCEYRVKRHWKYSGNIAELTGDISADNGGRITDLSLENVEFCGEVRQTDILLANGEKICKTAAEAVIYDGEVLPVLVKVTFTDGSAAEVYSGDDFWRHQCAANYAGGKAHHVISGNGNAVIWERKLLELPEETEVEKRPWRFKTVFAVSGEKSENNSDRPGFTFDGCFASPAKHRDFRTFIRQQPEGSHVQASIYGEMFCTEGSHVSRPGKKVLHGMFGELFDEYIWAGSAMARKGGSCVIKAAILQSPGSLILENMAKVPAELNFSDLEDTEE